MSGEEKGCDSAVYGTMVACEYRFCEVKIENPARGQKFCSQFCKNAEWAAVREDGKAAKKSKGKHNSSVASPINQRVLKFLSDGKVHTSWDIMIGARVVDHCSAISDLRKHGFNIPPAKLREIQPNGSKVFEYQLIEEI